eukprot:Opistho-1_new@41253
MNPKCARCDKTVYPTEKLLLLDKAWHKGCFNCEVCKITLTMKTYVALDKRPYCKTHYPKIEHTAVADTPENLRISANTKAQSGVAYKADFEAAKGEYTAVADDPNTVRAVQNSKMRANYDQRGQDESGQRSRTTSSAADEEPPARAAPQPVRAAPAPAPAKAPEPEPAAGPRYVANYSYDKADDDEVSFQEGDIIINGEIIDEGWMRGTVERTGESGMLPSNYVQLVE